VSTEPASVAVLRPTRRISSPKREAGFREPGASWTFFGLAGLAVLLTGVFRVCITYKLLGISTAKRRAGNEMVE
jgi:hypothetical protein